MEEYKLSNGLRVILAPDASLSNVTVAVRYDVGSRDEPPGLSGIAHLVEHLMFERSRHVPNGAFMSTLFAAGASDVNATTTFDSTIYHETLPAERLELALWLESDRMGYLLPALDQAALDQERKVVVTEMRTRIYDRPAGVAPLAVQEATFPSWHPYHGSPAGVEEEIEKMSLDDVRAFVGTWYGPDNAALVLAGRFEPERARALIERYFATLPSRPPPSRPALPPVAKKGPTRIEVQAAIGADQLSLTWITPALHQPGDEALDWVAVLLAGGDTSRLQDSLVAMGLADGVGARQDSRLLASQFGIQVVLAKDHKAAEAQEVIFSELQSFASSGPTAEEMKRARRRWASSALFGLQTSWGRASTLLVAASLGPLPVPFEWLDRRRVEITAEEVRSAAARYLAPGRLAGVVTVRSTPTASRWGRVSSVEEP